MTTKQDSTKFKSINPNMRALTLKCMSAKLKLVNSNTLNILRETESKCFSIAYSQENYKDLIEHVINIYKAQEAFYDKIAESLNNHKYNLKLEDNLISNKNDDKQEKNMNKEKILELLNKFKTAEKPIDKSRFLNEIKQASLPVYDAIINKLRKLKSEYEEQNRKVEKQKLNELEEFENKKIKLDDEPRKDDIQKCPICLDSFNEIKLKKRNIMSTNCGHLICSECVDKLFLDGPNNSIKCFSCRKNLRRKNLHNIYL